MFVHTHYSHAFSYYYIIAIAWIRRMNITCYELIHHYDRNVEINSLEKYFSVNISIVYINNVEVWLLEMYINREIILVFCYKKISYKCMHPAISWRCLQRSSILFHLFIYLLFVQGFSSHLTT